MAKAKHVILYLAANPADTARLALDVEVRAITTALEGSTHRDRFELVTRWAVEPLDLLTLLRKHRPTVVHFAGHGAGDGGEQDGLRDFSGGEDQDAGLYFAGDADRARFVPASLLGETLAAAGSTVRLVVLNACYSERVADVLTSQVDCVVGMSGGILDGAAIAFARGFYATVGEAGSLAAAVGDGRVAIGLASRQGAPELRVRAGFEPAGCVLAHLDASVRRQIECPYPGMRPFTAGDAEHFHGRDREIADVFGRIDLGEREIYVIGPSGSGKSSLVAAGVRPRLDPSIAVRTLRPGAIPATQLASLVAELGASARRLVIVDQLEEVFTPAADKERAAFFEALRRLRAAGGHTVLFTLRADFMGALMESPLWTDRLSRIEIAPLGATQLRPAIERPARDAGVEISDALTERLLVDAASRGSLPLLQETLRQLWDMRADQTLTLDDYDRLSDGTRNGLAVTLSRRADATLRELTREEEVNTRRILLRLVQIVEGLPETRRQQPLAELRRVGGADALERLIRNRLVTADADKVDLAHDAMITAWPTLRSWIETYRADEHRRRSLERAAADWSAYRHGVRGLLDQYELAEAEAWQRTDAYRELGPEPGVEALIAASRAELQKAEHRRLALEASSKKWIKVGLATGFAGVIAVGIVGAFFARAAGESAANRELAEVREREKQQLVTAGYFEAGRQHVVEGRAQEAIPYLLAARERGVAGEALAMLIGEARGALPLLSLRHGDKAFVGGFSPDGALVLTWARDTAVLWDRRGTQVATLTHPRISSATFSPDGTRIVTTGDAVARLWDVATFEPIGRGMVHADRVSRASFSRDGARLATIAGTSATVWDVASQAPIGDPMTHPAHEHVASVAFDPSGTRLATASYDKQVRIWDLTNPAAPAKLLAHGDRVQDVAWTPDARVVAGSWDGKVHVWDPESGQVVTTLEHDGGVRSTALTLDGTRVLTVSTDVSLWDLSRGVRTLRLPPPVIHAIISPDAKLILTTSTDGTASAWETTSGIRIALPFQLDAQSFSAAIDRDGKRVVVAGAGKRAYVWEIPAAQRVSISAHRDTVFRAEIAADDQRVVTAGVDKAARIWALTSGELLRELLHPSRVTFATFIAGGTQVATHSDIVRVWDANTGALVRELPTTRGAQAFAISADGARVATTRGAIATVATSEGEALTSFRMEGAITSVAFSPDGARLIAGNSWGTVRVWDARTGDPVPGIEPLHHSGKIETVGYSRDGRRIITGSDDRSARVWDATTGHLIGTPRAHNSRVWSATLSPDGTRASSTTDSGGVEIWDAATGKPLLGRALVGDGVVRHASFSADGERIALARGDGTVEILTVPLDRSEPATWPALSARSKFQLEDGNLLQRAPD